MREKFSKQPELGSGSQVIDDQSDESMDNQVIVNNTRDEREMSTGSYTGEKRSKEFLTKYARSMNSVRNSPEASKKRIITARFAHKSYEPLEIYKETAVSQIIKTKYASETQIQGRNSSVQKINIIGSGENSIKIIDEKSQTIERTIGTETLEEKRVYLVENYPIENENQISPKKIINVQKDYTRPNTYNHTNAKSNQMNLEFDPVVKPQSEYKPNKICQQNK